MGFGQTILSTTRCGNSVCRKAGVTVYKSREGEAMVASRSKQGFVKCGWKRYTGLLNVLKQMSYETLNTMAALTDQIIIGKTYG